VGENSQKAGVFNATGSEKGRRKRFKEKKKERENTFLQAKSALEPKAVTRNSKGS